MERPAGGDVVQVAHPLPAAPDRRRGVLAVALDQAQALAEEGGAAGGVQHPAAGDGLLLSTVAFQGDPVIEFPQLHLPHPHRPQELGTLCHGGGQQVLVQRVATELEGRGGAALEGPGLAGLGVAVHLLVLKPVPEPLLGQVLALQVLPLGEAPGEEHARHLGRGLAHLGIEGRRLLDHEHGELRPVPLQQDGRRSAAEGAAEDDDVVVFHRVASRRRLRGRRLDGV